MLRFVGDGDQKNSAEIPAIFQCKFPGKFEEKNHEVCWRAGKVIITLVWQILGKLPADFSANSWANFSRPRIVSLHSYGKDTQEESSMKISGNFLQNFCSKKAPTHFCRLIVRAKVLSERVLVDKEPRGLNAKGKHF